MDRNVEDNLAILAGRNLFSDDKGQIRFSQFMRMVTTLRQAITLMMRDYHGWDKERQTSEREAFAQIVIATLAGHEKFISPLILADSAMAPLVVSYLGYHDPSHMWSFYDRHIASSGYVELTEGISAVEHGSALVTHAIKMYESNADRWTLEINPKLAHHAALMLFGAFWTIAKSPNAAKLETQLMVDPGAFGKAYIHLRSALLIRKNNS